MTEYLGNHDKSNSQERVARVGYGNLEESSRFWLEGDEIKCKLCVNREENLKHCVTECEKMNSLRGNMKGIRERKYCEGAANRIRSLEKKRNKSAKPRQS